jgi:RNA polymerase sigma-70 factor (ECF subfamily)
LGKDQLEIHMNQIPERYQLILKLYYLEGYDHEEISEILNISYANSRTLLSRAKTNLKERIQ